MIDDAFLRQIAALQANLKMLESQQDVLSDLADMQALRQLQSRLADCIDGHAAAGNLPRNPFHVIEGRLRALENFFSETSRETKRLTSWLKDAPSVDLATLEGLLVELDAKVAEVSRIQKSLRAKISVLDWKVGPGTAELHHELLICASSLSGLDLKKPEHRQAAYQFAHGSGKMAEEVAKHFEAVGVNIREWITLHDRRAKELITLHDRHAKELAQIEQDVQNQQIRSAERRLEALGDTRFIDLNYTSAESGVKKLQSLLQRFTTFSSTLPERAEKGELSAINVELQELARLITKTDSDLGRELLSHLGKIRSFVEKESKIRTKDKFIALITTTVQAITWTLVILAVWHSSSAVTSVVAGSVAFVSSVIGVIVRNKRNIAWQSRRVAVAEERLTSEIGAGRVGTVVGVPLAGNLFMHFAFCPAGSFTMGSPPAENGRSSDENQVSVTLSKAFWMAKTEVTQAQWRAVMVSNPSSFKGDNLPVESVSWEDAQEFIKKVNDRGVLPEGWQMALPTEAQWEYACRAGETGPYSGGTLDEVSWYMGNSDSKTRPVGTKKANAWGLHDMHGNVWEWCADWNGNEHLGGTDPTGASSSSRRVYRGGSWGGSAASCRAAKRNGSNPTHRYNALGFRPALVPSE